mgnify:FL=1
MTIQQKTKTCQQKPAEFFPQAIGPVSPAFSQVALLAGPFFSREGTNMSSSKCKHVQCQAVQYGQSDEVAIPDDGMVRLFNCDGDKIPYQSWMEGLCQDCITAINESGVMCLEPYEEGGY